MVTRRINNSTMKMNKTVWSILSLTTFSVLLIAITLFCGDLGFGRLFGIYGIMEYCLLGMLVIIDILVIYKVYKLYAMQPKAIMLLLGLECCSILLWFAFIYMDQSLLDWQITNFILQEKDYFPHISISVLFVYTSTTAFLRCHSGCGRICKCT